MKLFLLAAGKPAHGDKPAALKYISTSTTVLDWKIHSFQSIIDILNIYFLGGYHVNEFIEKYSSLNFSIIPDWENKNILHTFFSTPFTNSDAVISYSDTIFHKIIIKKLLSFETDIVFGFDAFWKERFEDRSPTDNKNSVFNQISNAFNNQNLIIRSSSKGEDNWNSFNADNFESILNVNISNQHEIIKAVNDVIDSYGNSKGARDQAIREVA